MKNLSKEKRDRLVLTFVSTLVILVGLWQGVINLQKQKIAEMALRTGEEETRVNGAKRLVELTEQIKQSATAKAEELNVIEQGMASGDMYSWIIMKVNQFKAGYDVEIPQFSREVPTEVGMFPGFPYRAAQFNIRGKAFYHEFGRFLADFENAFPYLRVQNIDFEPASSSVATSIEEEGPTEKLSFRMEIVTLINPNVP